jgi:cobalt-zinc-cadmium resistance protein CzcA
VKIGQPGEPAARLREVAVSAPNGERIPLSQLAEFTRTDGLAEIFREDNVRRLSIKWSVRERDMGSLVTEAMEKVEAVVKLPPGYRLVWSGRFEDQQRALSRLYIIVPLVVFIIFVLLFGAFNSMGDALLIMLNLPFALIGGTLALYFWQSNFNISAAVGYIAVFGVSVLNGTVLVSSIRQAFSEGLPLGEAIVRGCEIRFRPIMVSAIVAVIGFLPAALSHGIGSEIQKPLARVVIGGLISSTALTLFALPAVFSLFAARGREAAPRDRPREPPTA